MAVLIDTDVLIRYERGGGHHPDHLGDEEPAVSVVTVSELLHGVYRAQGAQRMRRRALVEYLLGGLPAISITDRVARVHAELWADLASAGNLIGAHDLWIAATAVAHDMGVVTGNGRDFLRVPGLRVIPVDLS